jgi:ribosome-associated heat shock protein Hsp15
MQTLPNAAKTGDHPHAEEAVSARLDLWLWAARFFKTRAAAKAAIESGKVRVNGAACKAAKTLHGHELVRTMRGEETLEVRVLALSTRRAAAPIAALLYEELPDSLSKRTLERERKRLDRLGYQAPATKPDKRDRRKIAQFERADGNTHDTPGASI